LVSSGDVKGKVDLLDSCKLLQEKGLKIYATAGTQKFLAENGVTATAVNWPDETHAQEDITELMQEHKIDLVINIPKNQTRRELTNGYKIRRAAIDHNIPLLTNARLASAFLHAACSKEMSDIAIKSWQEYQI
ncbi:MAG: carbamoyl phosphate synthase large subunit, partial [Bacteroidales bacterium]|nr:carbamoyl phosphate synthase large subunit [Bacteroidales bacterium]